MENDPTEGSVVPCNFYAHNTDFYLVVDITFQLPGDGHVL
jgi:hypothetical protein